MSETLCDEDQCGEPAAKQTSNREQYEEPAADENPDGDADEDQDDDADEDQDDDADETPNCEQDQCAEHSSCVVYDGDESPIVCASNATAGPPPANRTEELKKEPARKKLDRTASRFAEHMKLLEADHKRAG